MSDVNLDPTAARANDPGWTPAALKESRRLEKKADKEAKAAKREKKRADDRAAWAKFWGTIGRAIAAVWDFMIRNILLTAAITGVICGGLFEWANSGRGWKDLYPGFNGIVIGAAAAAAVLLWYVAVSLAIGEWKKAKRDLPTAIGWTVAACLAYFVTVSGVFVATATNSVRYQQAAKESRLELATLKGEAARLKDDLEIYNEEYWLQSAAQVQRAIDQRVNTARNTWGLPDLEVNGGCAQPKLAFEARRMCSRVNGGDDPTTGEILTGIRTELENLQRNAKQAKADAEKLSELQTQIKNFHVVEGDQTAKAMEDLAEGGISGERAIAILYWLLSSAFLLLMGWAGHWAWEEIQAKRAAARVKKGLPT